MLNSRVAIVAGSELADYHFGEQHPFGPQRHQAFIDGMSNFNLDSQVQWLEPVQCCLQDLLSFHTADYVENVKQKSDLGYGYLDQGDTPARKGIYEAASTVVGSVILMLDQIMMGVFDRGFVPIAGLHHAYADHSSGFCVFNDCAIAIEHLRNKYHLTRILYVDIDAHHGDGVYYSYQCDPQVIIVDLHEDGQFLYPGTGRANETGIGNAQGSKLNIPMPMYADDNYFAEQWVKAEAFIESIQPEFIILQCGADSIKGDPITHLEYSAKSFQLAAKTLCRIADKYCQGRMLGLGGGGYNMQNIALAWPTVVKVMCDRT